jgi:hypothetical protein
MNRKGHKDHEEDKADSQPFVLFVAFVVPLTSGARYGDYRSGIVAD